MRIFLTLVLVLALAGCATTPQRTCDDMMFGVGVNLTGVAVAGVVYPLAVVPLVAVAGGNLMQGCN